MDSKLEFESTLTDLESRKIIFFFFFVEGTSETWKTSNPNNRKNEPRVLMNHYKKNFDGSVT